MILMTSIELCSDHNIFFDQFFDQLKPHCQKIIIGNWVKVSHLSRTPWQQKRHLLGVSLVVMFDRAANLSKVHQLLSSGYF